MLLRDWLEALERRGIEVQVVEVDVALADKRVEIERVGVGVLGLSLRFEAKD